MEHLIHYSKFDIGMMTTSFEEISAMYNTTIDINTNLRPLCRNPKITI